MSVALENKARLPFIGIFFTYILPGKKDFTLVCKFQARDDAKQGCLSRPAGTDKGYHFTRFDLEIHLADGREGSEAFGKRSDFDAHGNGKNG